MALPQINIALNGWESDIILNKITSTITDFEKVEAVEEIEFTGVVQPLDGESLRLKPLESRSWEWLMIHTKADVALSTGDLITYEGDKFKIMLKKDYSLNGFYEYHLVKDYE